MGKKVMNNRMFLRPSPNEEIKLLEDEKQKLRKLRLQQVRQQEKVLASRARKKFKEKEKKEIDILESELKKKWQKDIMEKRSMLENEYYENVAHVGEGHQAALMCEDGAPKERSLEDEIKASERYREAIKKLRDDDAEKAQIINEKNDAKSKAMEMEKARAARVAALEPPVPDIAQNLETIQKHRYKQSNIDHYSSTYYHIPRERVERADPNFYQVDARHAAKEEEERLQNAKEESDRNFSEQMEKARLRHKHARSKIMLEKDHNKLLEELEHFERVDRQRRQEIVSKIPKHVFEPPHRRVEANEERQREIEHAFEDIYMEQTNYMGDVTVAQDVLPVSPAMTDEESSVEREEQAKADVQEENGEENVQNERHSAVGEGKRKFIEEAEKSRMDAGLSSKDPLKRLLKKIDIQRDRWKSDMKTGKEIEERRNIADVVIPDNESEISEGMLTMTTENTRSASVESYIDKRTTLLHPHEEAERMRAASKYVQIPDATRKIEIEKQREKLQQQKLKLQLQQQQIMQEHLQLQFDVLNNEMKADESKDESTSETHSTSPTVDMKDTEFPDLSSGILSDEGKTVSESVDEAGIAAIESAKEAGITAIQSVDEAGIGKSSEDDVHADLTHSYDSRVNANVARHRELHSIPESVSEDDFVLLPPVSSVAILSGVSQLLPLHFVTSTTSGVTKLVSTARTRMSPSLPVNPTQYNTGLQLNQPQLDASLDEPSRRQPSLHISPPHIAIPAASHSEELIVSSPVPTLTHSVAKQLTSYSTDPIKQPDASVRYDNHGRFMFPRSKPALDSENIPRGIEHGRVVISDSDSPFFHIPTSVSSTPFVLEGPSIQFPSNRETDTASYLQFYQQQLLEQQNRIREQQKAIQERQQKRLEQLKQFQERLRGQRHDSDVGQASQTREKYSHSDGQWKSLIPSTRYSSDEDTSTSTDHAQSRAESADRALAVNIDHPTITPPLNQPKLKSFTTDTSSSLSPCPSEVRSIKDNDASLLPKTTELGLWSDSTPHLSLSDATKSTSSALDESKTDKKLPTRPKLNYEFGLSSSSLSNNGTTSEMNSFNHSSERSSRKSGSTFDSGPLSISSLPKSVEKHISSDSSASDSNNNLLLQRMENSFQHFQEMIDEAKALNDKYLDETRQRRNEEKRSSLENIKKKDDVKEGDLDNIPRSKEHRITRQSNEGSPGLLAGGQKIRDSIPDTTTYATSDEFCEPVLLKNQGDHAEDEDILEEMLEPNEENTQTKDFALSEKSTILKEYAESRTVTSPILSNQEDLNLGDQSAEKGMLAVDHEQSPSYYDSSPRALSVIPEETRISDDDLSEGVLEEEEEIHRMLHMDEYKEHQVDESLSCVPRNEDYFINIPHGDEEFHNYREMKGSETGQSFSPPGNYAQPTSTSLNYSSYHSPDQTVTQPLPTSSDEKLHLEKIQHTPEKQSWRSLDPGGVITSAEASKKFGLHVDLPTTEKRSYNDSSSFSPSTNDVVFSGMSSLSLSQTDESSASGLSLQEAFHKSRPQFVKHSQERLLRAKEARYKHSPVKKKHDDSQDKTSEITKNKTPETAASISKLSSEKIIRKQSSDGRQKIGKEEMKDRTKRLYESLPDIQEKAAQKQRQETYKANREKAQEFQKQTRERLRKLNAKKTGKKT